MSYNIYCKGENVWQPARKVGDYFFASVEALEKLIEADSGITMPLSDSLEIEPATFNNFVEQSLNFIEETNNTRQVAMMSGLIEIIVNLNSEINGFQPKITPKNQHLIERSKKVFYPLEDYLN